MMLMTTTQAKTPEHAVQTLMRVQVGYAARGIALCQAALCGAKQFIAWQHYPKKDYSDSSTGYEFYYHAHERSEMPASEHGHFHIFRRELEHPEKFIHLIGIALDTKGLPVRLFTTNQWVTGESMADAKTVQRFITELTIRPKGRIAPISKWIRAMLTLYAVEIASLVDQRDLIIAGQTDSGIKKSIFLEDRSHHCLTTCQINLIEKLSLQ
jgi:hypothetical protein